MAPARSPTAAQGWADSFFFVACALLQSGGLWTHHGLRLCSASRWAILLPDPEQGPSPILATVPPSPPRGTLTSSLACVVVRIYFTEQQSHAFSHMHTHTHTYTHTHTLTHTYTHTHAHKYSYINTHTCTHTCTHTHLYIHSHTCTQTHIHTCIHIYTQKNRHTYLYTHIYSYTHTHKCRHHIHIHTHTYICTHTCTQIHTHMLHTHTHYELCKFYTVLNLHAGNIYKAPSFL